MHNSTEIILDVKQLTVSFETDSVSNIAVDNLSFSIYKGETLAIVGESGSGKSVSSLAIMGLLPQPPATINTGEILFQKQNILKDKHIEKIRGHKIAMIFQEPMTSLNPLMTCGKQVCEAIMLHKHENYKTAKQHTIDLFNEVKIPEPNTTFNKYPHELSGGQKQRVMIAMALSCRPDLIIADEPTTALDVMVQASILELLSELQVKYGMSILFITHDLGLVKHFAHRTLVMYQGRKVELNTTENIFQSPQENYTKALLSCRPNPVIRLKTLPVIADFMKEKVFQPDIISDTVYIETHTHLQLNETILEIKNLSLQYITQKNIFGQPLGYFQALTNINFIVKKGETVGIVGESGCGKTTLGKSIVKLEKYSSGSITFKGQNIYTKDTAYLKLYPQKVQIIYQDPYSSLNPRITIGAAIKEPMDYYGIGVKAERKENVLRLLEKVGLQKEFYNRYPHEFSGGQRQRICIARVLAMQPDLIICDESVSALDISIQAQVLNLLCDLREEFNLTLLFISHDLSVVNHLCNRVIVMQKGEIVEENETTELFKHPQTNYTKELLSLIQ